MANRVQRKKFEFSQLACVLASLVFMFIGCWMIWRYYMLVQLAIETNSAIAPDSALPVTGITAIIVPLISYLLYQFKLKNSRNKYGISENGVPYTMPEENTNEL